MSYEHFPKDLMTDFFLSDRKLAEIAIEALVGKEPGILSIILKKLAELNVRLLGVNFTLRDDNRYIFLFLDITQSPIKLEKICEELRKIEGVIKVKFKENPYPGYILEVFGFPTTITMGNMRALIIPSYFFSEMLKEMYEKMSSGGEAIAFYEGVFMGETVFEIFPVKTSLKDTIKLLTLLYKAYGWGIMELVEFNLLLKKIVIRIYDNFESSIYKKTVNESRCHFTRGIITGLTRRLFNREVRVIEEKCRAKGDPYCEFIVKIL